MLKATYINCLLTICEALAAYPHFLSLSRCGNEVLDHILQLSMVLGSAVFEFG